MMKPAKSSRQSFAWARRLLVGLACAGAVVGPAAVTADDAEPMYLMFPYDYLGLPEAERRHYLLGVVDATLVAATGSDGYGQLSRCVAAKGLDALRLLVEKELIPRPNFGGVPMPFVIKQGLDQLCAPR